MYIHMYICVCMYVCMYNKKLHTCIKVCMYVRTYICIYVCVYVCMYVHPLFWRPVCGLPSVLFGDHRWLFRSRHSRLPSSTNVKSKWSYTSAPLTCLRGVCRDDFILLLNIDSSCIQQTGVGTAPATGCIFIRGLSTVPFTKLRRMQASRELCLLWPAM